MQVAAVHFSHAFLCRNYEVDTKVDGYTVCTWKVGLMKGELGLGAP